MITVTTNNIVTNQPVTPYGWSIFTEAVLNNSSVKSSKQPLSISTIDNVVTPILLIIGLLGNLIILRILTLKSFRQQVVSHLLGGITIMDILVTITIPFNKSYIQVCT